MERSGLKIDYNFALERIVGNRAGVSCEELESYLEITREIHEDMVRRREAGELGFYSLPYQDELVKDIVDTSEEVRSKYDAQVVFGIGGSSLGTLALQTSLCHPYHNELPPEKRNGLRTYVADNVDPEKVSAMMEMVDPEKTLFVIVSKSGGTAETAANFLAFWEIMKKSLGSKVYEHLVAITDPEKGVLRRFANEKGLKTFPIPRTVGGRFSVLTPVGLFPAANMGIDVRELLAGASAMDTSTSTPELYSNPAYLLAVIQHILYGKGVRISVLMPYSDALSRFADWYVQLWAESLGKKYSIDGTVVNVGPTPLKAVGSTDQHSQVQLFKEGPYDKFVIFLRVEKFRKEIVLSGEFKEYDSFSYLGGHTLNELINAEQSATAVALAREGRPSVTIEFSEISPSTVGEFIFLMEVATVFSGYLYRINPLDQPGVEEGKHFTYGLLGREGFADKRKEFDEFVKRTDGKYVV